MIHKAIDIGHDWQKKVSNILDRYSNEIAKNSEYIAYDLLDNSPLNENSVESIYSNAENWLDQSTEKRKFKTL